MLETFHILVMLLKNVGPNTKALHLPFFSLVYKYFHGGIEKVLAIGTERKLVLALITISTIRWSQMQLTRSFKVTTFLLYLVRRQEQLLPCNEYFKN